MQLNTGLFFFFQTYPKLVSFVIRSGNAGWLLSLVNVGTLLAEVKVSVSATRHSLKSGQCNERWSTMKDDYKVVDINELES